jgi:hypothetical protein
MLRGHRVGYLENNFELDVRNLGKWLRKPLPKAFAAALDENPGLWFETVGNPNFSRKTAISTPSTCDVRLARPESMHVYMHMHTRVYMHKGMKTQVEK